jgi:hypothetical protein
VQPGRGPKARTAPTLATTRHLFAIPRRGTAEEAICGEFQRIVDWKLHGVQGPGIIVQKVAKTFLIENIATGRHMSAAEVDAYVALSGGETRLSGWSTYWEAWVVRPGWDEPDSGDSFSLAAVVDRLGSGQNTTKGWFQMVGEAYFYKTSKVPSRFGFRAGLTTNAANGLPWSLSPPTGLPAPKGPPVYRTVRVRWDSTQEDPKVRGEYGPTKILISRVS